jgi:hypothetical protein
MNLRRSLIVAADLHLKAVRILKVVTVLVRLHIQSATFQLGFYPTLYAFVPVPIGDGQRDMINVRREPRDGSV